jgi:AraC-like DNA-binding protein
MCVLGLFIYRQKKKQKELVNIIHKKDKISPEGIRDLMLQNEQIISVEAIAEHYQTSVNQLGRVLKKYDTTPLNLIKEIKKEIVQDLLNKDIALAQIAHRVGYREAYVKANFIKKKSI